MKNSAIISIFIIYFSFSGCCKKENENTAPQVDALVFGYFYGMCSGNNCVKIFKLTDSEVFVNASSKYPSVDSLYPESYMLLPPSKFNLVKDLKGYFPTALLQETKRVIGMPDAGDWGGFYIETIIQGQRRFWLLDKMKSNVPSQYHFFMDKMDEKIALLL